MPKSHKLSINPEEKLAETITQLTLEGNLTLAKQALVVLSTFTNVQRLPGEDGQPGFGRGWGFGDPYENFGYGKAKSKRKVPNTGDMPTSFDNYVDEEEEEKKEREEKKSELGSEFDMDVALEAAIQKVEDTLGKKEASTFSEWFGILAPKVAEADEEEDEDDEEYEEVETPSEKKPRSRREVLQVWRDDLIPDITPIIRRVLKHVSVQYSLPFSTLTNALRGQESPVAGMLADTLDGVGD